MNKETFYMQLSHYLLHKFCEGHIAIDKSDWSKLADGYITIKHRINPENKLEVISFLNEQ